MNPPVQYTTNESRIRAVNSPKSRLFPFGQFRPAVHVRIERFRECPKFIGKSLHGFKSAHRLGKLRLDFRFPSLGSTDAGLQVFQFPSFLEREFSRFRTSRFGRRRVGGCTAVRDARRGRRDRRPLRRLLGDTALRKVLCRFRGLPLPSCRRRCNRANRGTRS